MSKHPIPDWLRSQFSLIEDEVQKLGPCGVFTQMRTVTQTYFEQQPAAPQPPAIGGEPEVQAELYDIAYRLDSIRKAENVHLSNAHFSPGRPYKLADAQSVARLAFDRIISVADSLPRLAPLQAEIERWKAISAVQKDRMDVALELAKERREERDQLKVRCDELQILLACRDDDMKSVSVEFDGLAQLLRCALPFVQARCDETDYGDASARTTQEDILNMLKRLYPSKPAGSEQV